MQYPAEIISRAHIFMNLKDGDDSVKFVVTEEETSQTGDEFETPCRSINVRGGTVTVSLWNYERVEYHGFPYAVVYTTVVRDDEVYDEGMQDSVESEYQPPVGSAGYGDGQFGCGQWQ